VAYALSDEMEIIDTWMTLNVSDNQYGRLS